ncbi:2-oxoglutarate-Fe(II) type oxidoreductase hxnY isoform X2 [Lactuca sativa]|uniref:2-oxoglutarate-Fe(II) type oxidoreductase hxnY isoform X2 n=1 Tax=Lactuca sativa TaxID=4236 RepID=UPI0022AF102B|nr:2-oxoglutarate-Fe(II) type oxidoreductase hxnY isoform X2 [Lactuca sativa]
MSSSKQMPLLNSRYGGRKDSIYQSMQTESGTKPDIRAKMAESVVLPVIDLSSSDRISTANSIRQACMEYGFFYLVNHGVEEELLESVFDESRKFFSLPLEEKMKLGRKDDVGFAPIYAENLDSSTTSKGDLKETFHIGPLEGEESHLNLWPSTEILPCWRFLMEKYYKKVLSTGERLSTLIALALNLEDDFFKKIGALDKPYGFLRLLHYPGLNEAAGEIEEEEVVYGASAHSDYGMITLLATDGVPGLQDRCVRKNISSHGLGRMAFIVNLGDMMERWTNCLFRSTLHRVMPTGKERYSMAFFLDPNPDCMVECLKSCCTESSPPRFPPVRSGDYLRDRITAAYSYS